LVVWDDHFALRALTLSGPARVITHQAVENDFPSIAMKVAAPPRHNGAAARNPEYWFLQEVVELIQQSERLVGNLLHPSRPTCSIHAGGRARHGKKPAYFAAETPASQRSPVLSAIRKASSNRVTGFDRSTMAPALTGSVSSGLHADFRPGAQRSGAPRRSVPHAPQISSPIASQS
jgi:hypothetical protein